MSVLTILLLLATCLSMLADGAPNKKNDENFQSLGQLRPQGFSPNPTKNTSDPSMASSGSLRTPLGNSFATGSGWFPVPSGTANTGSSFGSSAVEPYPTEGAPYQNATSSYTKQGNGDGGNGQSGSGNQCPPQQTVTLPSETTTLPAQTVTITPAPETITITSQAQTETVTVTVTPQTQLTTVTVWMTVTANQVPSCPSPSNASNPQIAPVPAPNAQLSNTPIAPASDNASTPATVPPFVTTPYLVVPLSTGGAVPIANATLPVIPNLGSTTATGPTNFSAKYQSSPVAERTSSFVLPIITSTPIIAPYPYRNTSNQTLPFGSGSSHGFRATGSGFAKQTDRHFSSYFLYKVVTDAPTSTTTTGFSSTRKYFHLSSLLTPPSQANATVFPSTAGPTAPPSSPTGEYFPDDGSSLLTPPTLANATASPTMEYFPDDGSSLLTPPAQANATNVSPLGGPTAPIITPAIVASSQALAAVVGSIITTPPPPPIIQVNTSTTIPPVSTPIPPPSPPIVQPNTSISLPASTSSSQISQPITTSTSPLCTNGTTAQNMTTNFSEIPPIPSMPLILQGLNFTTFAPFTTTTSNSTSPLPPSTHLLALSASEPKQITLAPDSLSFSITSLALSCGDTPSEVTATCTVQMFGIGAASGTERTVAVAGPGMRTVRMEEEGSWRGLSRVSFTAEMGGAPVGVRLGAVAYELVSAC
ncbi:hypothetical protein HO133_005906 [Letharia lupina]|uniref:Uncharacterized protein n=1 Tax=Letharia lupina TaxID=560253 RepID=A0A8H6F867_9LECA|nr:uncharacterized protein HO133_005906 [Letharia lupina]KAF6218556.1 hypothetical protein HO133_005906 [Letharia lupina]